MNEPEARRAGGERRGAARGARSRSGSARRDERDRTLARVRTTTAVTGIGAVLVGGVLVGWLGHEASQSSATDPASSSTLRLGLRVRFGRRAVGPDSVSGSGSGSDSGQPGITSGGS